MPEITDRQLIAAVSKAVEVGLLPRSASGEDYLANYEKVRAVLEAALCPPPPERGSLVDAIKAIRAAGGSDWDKVEDVEEFLGRG